MSAGSSKSAGLAQRYLAAIQNNSDNKIHSDGVDTVNINMLSICGSPNLSEWTLTIRVEGNLVETYTGTGNSDSFTIELPLIG